MKPPAQHMQCQPAQVQPDSAQCHAGQRPMHHPPALHQEARPLLSLQRLQQARARRQDLTSALEISLLPRRKLRGGERGERVLVQRLLAIVLERCRFPGEEPLYCILQLAQALMQRLDNTHTVTAGVLRDFARQPPVEQTANDAACDQQE